MTRRLLSVAAMILATSCGDSYYDTLEVSAGANYADAVFEMEWPPGSGDSVTVNQSLTDPKGLGSFYIEVVVVTEAPVVLNASDFRGRPNNTAEAIMLPDRGKPAVFMTLGAFGYNGYIEWTLNPGVESWNLAIERVPVALGITLDDDLTPRCHPPRCHQFTRIELSASERNYPGEALWLVLSRG